MNQRHTTVSQASSLFFPLALPPKREHSRKDAAFYIETWYSEPGRKRYLTGTGLGYSRADVFLVISETICKCSDVHDCLKTGCLIHTVKMWSIYMQFQLDQTQGIKFLTQKSIQILFRPHSENKYGTAIHVAQSVQCQTELILMNGVILNPDFPSMI